MGDTKESMMTEEERLEMIAAKGVDEKLLSIEKEYIERAKHLALSLGVLTAIQKTEILEKMQRLIFHRNRLLAIRRENRKTRRTSLLPNSERKDQ